MNENKFLFIESFVFECLYFKRIKFVVFLLIYVRFFVVLYRLKKEKEGLFSI